jgi:hypothetical protein
MSLFKQNIVQIMNRLLEKDFEGALPYLLLTSKSESIVRDAQIQILIEAWRFKGRN